MASYACIKKWVIRGGIERRTVWFLLPESQFLIEEADDHDNEAGDDHSDEHGYYDCLGI